MWRKGKLPLKRKYFHTKHKMDKKDMTFLKNRVQKITKRKIKKIEIIYKKLKIN
jgi:hypothetical protein